MSISEIDPTEAWPFYSIFFFVLVGLLHFPGGTYSDHPLLLGLSLLFFIPVTLFQALSSAIPLSAPLGVVLMTAFFFANVLRPTMGDAAYLALCGSFVAALSGV